MAADYWNQSLFTCKKHHGQIMTAQISREIHSKTMKYTNAPYVITEEEDNRIRNRRETFIRETGTEKTVLITIITSYGLAPGGYSDDIQYQLTMADLFR